MNAYTNTFKDTDGTDIMSVTTQISVRRKRSHSCDQPLYCLSDKDN